MSLSKSHIIQLENFTTDTRKYKVGNITWNITLNLEHSFLSIKVVCNERNISPIWKCSASSSFSIEGSRDVATNYIDFSAANNTFVIPKFKKWSVIVDLSKEGKVTLKIALEVKKIFGIHLSKEIDFRSRQENILDVNIKFNGEDIYVGKEILGLYSPYFKALFFSDFSEKDQQEICKINNPEVTTSQFIEFLRMIYPSKQTVTSENVECFLKLADRYDVPHIIARCEEWLFSDRNSLDVTFKLLLAEQFNLSQLQSHILKNLKSQKQVQNISKSKYYGDLGDGTKTALLNRMLSIMDGNDVSSDSDSSISSSNRSMVDTIRIFQFDSNSHNEDLHSSDSDEVSSLSNDDVSSESLEEERLANSTASEKSDDVELDISMEDLNEKIVDEVSDASDDEDNDVIVVD